MLPVHLVSNTWPTFNYSVGFPVGTDRQAPSPGQGGRRSETCSQSILQTQGY